MSEDRPTLRAVLDHLAERELLELDTRVRIGEHLAWKEQQRPDPFYIKILIGLGAWIAAICVFAAIFLTDLIPDTWLGMYFLGLGLVFPATALRRMSQRIFLTQLALVLCIAGNIAILAGVERLNHNYQYEILFFALAQAIFTLIIYPLFNDPVFRFASPLAAIVMLIEGIINANHYSHLYHWFYPLLAVEAAGVGLLFLWKYGHLVLAPLRYALAVALPGTVLAVLTIETISSNHVPMALWPVKVIIGAGLLALLALLAGRKRLFTEWMIIALITVVLLALFTSPGVLVSVGLLVLGYSRGDRFLIGIGLAFFPVFLGVFYYYLDISLTIKAEMLTAAGLVLLIARWVLGLRDWSRGSAP